MRSSKFGPCPRLCVFSFLTRSLSCPDLSPGHPHVTTSQMVAVACHVMSPASVLHESVNGLDGGLTTVVLLVSSILLVSAPATQKFISVSKQYSRAPPPRLTHAKPRSVDFHIAGSSGEVLMSAKFKEIETADVTTASSTLAD